MNSIRAALVFYLLSIVGTASAQRDMETLSRGVVALPATEGGVFVSWRLLGTESDETGFNVYRKDDRGELVRLNDTVITQSTNLVDTDAKADNEAEYIVRAVLDGQEQPASSTVRAWTKAYHSIPIKPINGYRPGDASVGDLDGDGEYEIVLHQTSSGRDNSFPGITGEPILDAYKLDGTHLWRINLGKNIREGEHYTQLLVYDLDSDGRAELVCKTADGTIDGVGKTIGDVDKDWRTLREGHRTHGRVLAGPEFLTVFDGQTGAALETVDYVPGREPIDGWGGIGGNAGNDNFGNRCDRFLACVAYLDGRRPSFVMCRGVYGRTVLAAWDWRDGRLSRRWVFDTGSSYPPFRDASPYAGMGGHSISVADVDGDGRDEIVYQAMVVDDDGSGLYSTGLRHGDMMHVADMYPDRPGLEIFTVQENEERAEQFQTPGVAMRDARTGEILWSHSPTADVPHGMAADIDPRHRGYEAWGGPGGLRTSSGTEVGRAPREVMWCIWWDGDPLRELLSLSRWRGTRVSKWDWEREAERTIFETEARGGGRGPVLMADLIGDWREELLLAAPDGRSLRLYTTNISTDRRLRTLMHDPQYRLGIAWQNVAYNVPCHPSFYLGDGMSPPTRPEIRLVDQANPRASAPRLIRSGGAR